MQISAFQERKLITVCSIVLKWAGILLLVSCVANAIVLYKNYPLIHSATGNEGNYALMLTARLFYLGHGILNAFFLFLIHSLINYLISNKTTPGKFLRLSDKLLISAACFYACAMLVQLKMQPIGVDIKLLPLVIASALVPDLTRIMTVLAFAGISRKVLPIIEEHKTLA